jgi:hypothetical protein
MNISILSQQQYLQIGRFASDKGAISAKSRTITNAIFYITRSSILNCIDGFQVRPRARLKKG